MKKLMITAALFCAVTASYAQTTTSSTDKAKTPQATGQGVNANVAGKYADHENANSMLFSREAIAIRRKNMTEPDTTMREGSGGAPRNTKNHTGVTGNYRNLATQTSGVPSRE